VTPVLIEKMRTPIRSKAPVKETLGQIENLLTNLGLKNQTCLNSIMAGLDATVKRECANR